MKRALESKTIWGIITLLMTHIANADWAAWHANLSEHIVFFTGAAFAIYGRSVAKVPLRLGRK